MCIQTPWGVLQSSCNHTKPYSPSRTSHQKCNDNARHTSIVFISKTTAPLLNAIVERHGQFNTDTIAQQQQCKVKVWQEKREAHLAMVDNLHPQFSPKLQKLMDVAKEKGSSSWLVALPIENHGFTLHKSAFHDAICLRYGWQPPLLPTT